MTEHEHEHAYEHDTATEPTTPVDVAPQSPATGWRHPVNVGHLVMGLAFLGLVLVWAVVVGTDVPDEDIRWLLPVPWVLAGGAGLVATALAARRSASRSS